MSSLLMVKTAHIQKEKQPDLCHMSYQKDAGLCAKLFLGPVEMDTVHVLLLG